MNKPLIIILLNDADCVDFRTVKITEFQILKDFISNTLEMEDLEKIIDYSSRIQLYSVKKMETNIDFDKIEIISDDELIFNFKKSGLFKIVKIINGNTESDIETNHWTLGEFCWINHLDQLMVTIGEYRQTNEFFNIEGLMLNRIAFNEIMSSSSYNKFNKKTCFISVNKIAFIYDENFNIETKHIIFKNSFDIINEQIIYYSSNYVYFYDSDWNYQDRVFLDSNVCSLKIDMKKPMSLLSVSLEKNIKILNRKTLSNNWFD